MTREEQIINFVTEKYRSLMYGKGNTPEGNGYLVAMGDVLRFVDKLPKEQEPQGLDEAAEEFRKNDDAKYPCDQCLVNTFKVGAKWMAEQGETVEGKIVCDVAYPHENKVVARVNGDYKFGDKVIVQIRKA